MLLLIGTHLGSRWREIDSYIAAYGWVITGLIVISVMVIVIRKRLRRTKGSAA